jgi:subtilisin family serine protease
VDVGTSFSAPVVSGLARRFLARHPDFTPDDVKGALMLTATHPSGRRDCRLGVGEVHGVAAAAVADPPNPNRNLYRFVRQDADGNPFFQWNVWADYVLDDRVLDGRKLDRRVGTDASWTDASWTDASWTDASWTGRQLDRRLLD